MQLYFGECNRTSLNCICTILKYRSTAEVKRHLNCAPGFIALMQPRVLLLQYYFCLTKVHFVTVLYEFLVQCKHAFGDTCLTTIFLPLGKSHLSTYNTPFITALIRSDFISYFVVYLSISGCDCILPKGFPATKARSDRDAYWDLLLLLFANQLNGALPPAPECGAPMRFARERKCKYIFFYFILILIPYSQQIF